MRTMRGVPPYDATVSERVSDDEEDDVEAEWVAGIALQDPEDRYRTLFHSAGLHDPAGLRELAEMHRERVRRGRVPPVLRGVV